VGQQIAYEVPLLLSALPVVLMVGSLNLNDIVAAQDKLWFFIPQFPALLLFVVASLVELNQTPFDMSEAESELVAGFSSEYASMKFGLLFLSEFSNLFIMAGLTVTLFFGGWSLPFIPAQIQAGFAPIVFVAKTYLVIFFFMWIRGTFPRVRVDQLQQLGWKVLLPANLAWLLVTGVAVKLVEAVAR
jgi:NADH-quinone oxidoreductase subunit H